MLTDTATLFIKAEQYRQQHQWHLAIETYHELLTSFPHHPGALYSLALSYAECGDIPNAIPFFHQALRYSPPDKTIHNNLANAYKAMNDMTNAFHHYQQALTLDPHYAVAQNNLAALYATQGQIQHALKHYRLALHSAPDFVTAHYNLGLLLLRQQAIKEAKTQFKNVIALDPTHIGAPFYLGLLYIEENQLDNAEEALENIISLDPTHTDALTNLGVIALKRNKNQMAVDFFTKALGYDQTHIEARNNLAATFIHHDRFENALMHYDVLLQNDPTNLEYLYNSGVAQMALGHLQKAREHFETLLRFNPQHVDTLTNLAAIHIRLHQHQDAIALLEQAQCVCPEEKTGQFMLAALTGQPLTTPSASYVTHLFNNYAIHYEQHMQEILHYTLPEHIARLLHQLKLPLIKHTLDLGCGTGLCGMVLRKQTQHLAGVDLSTKMLAIAKNKCIYDDLFEDDMVIFLNNATQTYDLLVAADVFPYLGELETLFNRLKQRLSPSGVFIFTHEISDKEPWSLQVNARFCHHPHYIQTLYNKYGLKVLLQQKTMARKHEHQPVYVMLYALAPL